LTLLPRSGWLVEVRAPTLVLVVVAGLLPGCDKLLASPDAGADASVPDAHLRTRFDLAVAGTALRAYDGARVFASLTDPMPSAGAPARVTRQLAVIASGAFSLSFPGGLAADHGVLVRVLVDSDADDVCTGGELAYRRSFQAGYDATLPLAARDFDAVATVDDCAGF
jgi:hypothetical protein